MGILSCLKARPLFLHRKHQMFQCHCPLSNMQSCVARGPDHPSHADPIASTGEAIVRATSRHGAHASGPLSTPQRGPQGSLPALRSPSSEGGPTSPAGHTVGNAGRGVDDDGGLPFGPGPGPLAGPEPGEGCEGDDNDSNTSSVVLTKAQLVAQQNAQGERHQRGGHTNGTSWHDSGGGCTSLPETPQDHHEHDSCMTPPI